ICRLRLQIDLAVTAARTAVAGATATSPAPGWVVAATLAAAAAVLHALRVGKLVPQAALEAAAEAGQLRRVEAQILLLPHLDGARLDRLQERRAAQRPPAPAVAPVHLRLVAHADLAHLDARAELRGELAHEFPEIDAAVGREIEDQLRAVEGLFDARELHPEAALADLQQRYPVRLLLAALVLQTRDDVVARREAHDALRRVGRRTPLRLELRNVLHDRADGGTAVGVHDDTIAGAWDGPAPRLLAEQKRVRAPHGVQLHGDERRLIRRAHSCSTSQSATILTPAFRSSATSASSTAANARTPRSPRYAVARRSSAGRTSEFASARASAPVASTSTSRSSDAI